MTDDRHDERADDRPDDRTDPPLEADERTTLTAFLDFLRGTLALKCDGLTDDQLRERAVPPSNLSLLGLVRHMAEVERNWFWRAECDHARALVAAAPSFDVTGVRARGYVFSLRWVVTHMIEEYARHLGHADLIRERLDGSTGE
jgi:hypothetical protein